MARYSGRRYRLSVAALMTAYVALTLFVWPHARSAQSLGWKIALSLLPVVPVVITIWFMAERIIHSDEFQQRVHMIALSVATCVVAALSLVGGFLAAAHAVPLEGDVPIWVNPALCLVYGIAHLALLRRYGAGGCEQW